MSLQDYNEAVMARQRVISENRSRHMRGLPRLPVPEKPEWPKVPVAYDAEGNYVGRLKSADECPSGCEVRMENQAW